VLSGRGLCDELITRPEESYRLCCVVVWDLETSRMRRSWPALGSSARGKNFDIQCVWQMFYKVSYIEDSFTWRDVKVSLQGNINFFLYLMNSFPSSYMWETKNSVGNITF
jgi:hypothetical protein